MNTKALRNEPPGGGRSAPRRRGQRAATTAAATPTSAQVRIDAETLRDVPLPSLFPDLDWSQPMSARAQAFLLAAQALAEAGEWQLCAEYAAAAQRCAARVNNLPVTPGIGAGPGTEPASACSGGPDQQPAGSGPAARGTRGQTAAAKNAAPTPALADAAAGAAHGAAGNRSRSNAAKTRKRGSQALLTPTAQAAMLQGAIHVGHAAGSGNTVAIGTWRDPQAGEAVELPVDEIHADIERASLNGVEVSEVWYERVSPQPFDWAETFERPWDPAPAVEPSTRERLAALARHPSPRFVLDWTESVLQPETDVAERLERHARARAGAARTWLGAQLVALAALGDGSPRSHVELCGAAALPVAHPADLQLARLDLSTAGASSLPDARKAAAAALPLADASVASLSCTAVLEHVGLDAADAEIDYDADLRAVRELRRVVAPGGQILLAVPLGQPRLPLHGPRIYSYRQVIEMFRGFHLQDFALATDADLAGGRGPRSGLLPGAGEALADEQDQGLGCFRFVRPGPSRSVAPKVPEGLKTDASTPVQQGARPGAQVDSQADVLLEALACGHGLKTLVDVRHLSGWPRHVRFDQVVHLSEPDAEALARTLAAQFRPALVRLHASGVDAELLGLLDAVCRAPDRGHAVLVIWQGEVPTAAELARLGGHVLAQRPAHQVRQAGGVTMIVPGSIPGGPDDAML